MIGENRSRAAGRCGAPPRFAEAALAAALLTVPAVLSLVPRAAAVLEYDRVAIAAGEWWRAVTCHWTHWSLDHFAWDVVAFAILVVLGWRRSPRRTVAALVPATLAIPLGLWVFWPSMALYRGLSGLDSALFACVALSLVQEELDAGRRWPALLVGAIVACFAAKIAFEFATGATLFADSSTFVAVPLAHVIGAACGLIATGIPNRRPEGHPVPSPGCGLAPLA